MAVLCEAINVIVAITTLELRWPGGVAGYESTVPNQTYCTDGLLSRVGFMAPSDAKRFVARLEARGLVVMGPAGKCLDVVVVDPAVYRPEFCDWIETMTASGQLWAWHTGHPTGELVTPRTWRPSKITHHEPEDVLIDKSGGTKWTVLDPETGDVSFIGRAYKELVQAEAYAEQAQQALDDGDNRAALGLFELAFAQGLQSAQAFYAAGVAALNLNDPQEAARLFQASLRLAPESSVTFTNLAAAQLMCNQPELARLSATEATRLNPRDSFAWISLARALVLIKDYTGARDAALEAEQVLRDDGPEDLLRSLQEWMVNVRLIG